MNSVGIDLHRNRSHIAAIDDEGAEVLSRRIVNDPETFLELLGDLDGETEVALEATYGWEWLAELIEEAGYELHLAHPLRTKAIAAARVKTDAVDARTLAQLLRADLLPEAYVARGRFATCATCSVIGSRSPRSARRSRTGSTPSLRVTASTTVTRTCSAPPAASSSPSSRCASRRSGASTRCWP